MKFQKKRIILAALVALLLASAGLLLFLREFQKISPEKMLKIMADRVDLEVRNVLYREVGDTDTKWEIRAKKASYLKKENQALFEKLEVKVFLAGGSTFLMVGDKGELNTDTKDITVSGNVIVDSGREERFETDNLQFSYADKRLHTEAAVSMKTPQMSISGVGMSLSLVNRDLILLSKVHARINGMSDRR